MEKGMEIVTIIRTTLYKNNVVVVPLFGTFRIKDQSARLIKTDKIKFIPPQKIITYSNECVAEDNTLSVAVSAEYGCSTIEADACISKFVEQQKNDLSGNNSVFLDGIGTLYTDGSFESAILAEENAKTFGLKDFSFDKLQ